MADVISHFRTQSKKNGEDFQRMLKLNDLINIWFMTRTYYKIDDLSIYQMIMEDPGKSYSFEEACIRIRSVFRNEDSSHYFDGVEYVNDKKVVPFSRVINNEPRGKCLEQAITFQLWQQTQQETYMVHGWMSDKNRSGPHRFNVVFRDDTVYLTDVVNPLGSSGGTIIPFIVPILGVKNGKIIVAEDNQFGREYLDSSRCKSKPYSGN